MVQSKYKSTLLHYLKTRKKIFWGLMTFSQDVSYSITDLVNIYFNTKILFYSNLLLWDFLLMFWKSKSRIDLPNQDQVFQDFLAKGRYSCQLWCAKEVLGKYKHKNDLKFKEYYFLSNSFIKKISPTYILDNFDCSGHFFKSAFMCKRTEVVSF